MAFPKKKFFACGGQKIQVLQKKLAFRGCLLSHKASSKAIFMPFLEQSDSNLSGSAPAAPKFSRARLRRALFDLSPIKSLFQRNREMK